MRTSRSQPFSLLWDPLQQFQQEMNGLFDRWGRDGTGGAAFPAVNRGPSREVVMPPVNPDRR